MCERKFNVGDRVELLTVQDSLELVSEFFHVGELGTVVDYDFEADDGFDDDDVDDDYDFEADDGLEVFVLFDGHKDNVILSEYEIKKVGE